MKSNQLSRMFSTIKNVANGSSVLHTNRKQNVIDSETFVRFSSQDPGYLIMFGGCNVITIVDYNDKNKNLLVAAERIIDVSPEEYSKTNLILVYKKDEESDTITSISHYTVKEFCSKYADWDNRSNYEE